MSHYLDNHVRFLVLWRVHIWEQKSNEHYICGFPNLEKGSFCCRKVSCYDRQQEIINPLHYLPLIRQRPGALAHAKPIRQWREKWSPVYEQLLAQLQQKWPDGRGLREFVQILYLHRDHETDEIEAAITSALAHHCAHADGVKLWLTQSKREEPTFSPVDLAHKPALHGLGEQPLQLALYDSLVGGD